MQPLLFSTRPDFDWALFNFRIFLKIGGLYLFGARDKLPLPPLPSRRPCILYVNQKFESKVKHFHKEFSSLNRKLFLFDN